MGEATQVIPFYEGSELLRPLGDYLGVPLDQINFFIAHLVTLVLGGVFRVVFAPSVAGPVVRHLIEICLGVFVIYFCYGRQIIIMLSQCLIAYSLMAYIRVGIMEKAVLLFSMSFLSCFHIYRMVTDYGGYTLDITGPLMISTQKLTSLAFNLYDGSVDQPKTLKALSIKEVPKLHEFLGYVFCFHSVMCGPFFFYSDYMAFIDGSHFLVTPFPNKIPSPRVVVFKKIITASFFGIMTTCVAPYWPCMLITNETFAEQTFVYKNFLVVFVSTLHRYKYYFAWCLSEASNINAGLGFNGYDANDDAKWDLIDNSVPLKTELALNMKQFIDNWNKSTTIWLRFIIYERTHNTMAVFCFSAFWHGFYPGYYITFLSAGIFILVSRKLRKLLRHHFQVTQLLSVSYDILTYFMTSITMCYVGFPFMVLLAQPSLFIYWNLYFYQHIISLFLLATFAFWDYKLKTARQRSL